MIVSSDRLVLRNPTISDAPFLLRLVNNPSWIENIGDRKVYTIQQAEKYLLNGTIKSFTENGFGFGIAELKTTGEAIGMCGFVKRDFLEDVDIGFAFLPEFTRKGYAYEISREVLVWGRRDLGFKKVLAITLPTNTPSIRLLEKLGLRKQREIESEGDILNVYVIDF